MVEEQVTGSFHLQCADTAFIGEGDGLAVFRELPARRLVFNRTDVLLKLRVALFPFYLFLAVVVSSYWE